MSNKLKEFDIAHEKIQHVQELLSDSQALENNYIFEFENRNKTKVKMAMSPIKFNNIEINTQTDAPLIGEHNTEILEEIGYKKEEIIKFYEENIIAKK